MQTNFEKHHCFASALKHHFYLETLSSCLSVCQQCPLVCANSKNQTLSTGPLLIDEGGALNPLLIDEGGFSVMSYYQPFDSVIFPFTVLSGFDCDYRSLMKQLSAL